MIFRVFAILNSVIARIKTLFLYKVFFYKIGKKSIIFKPYLISGSKYIRIGNNSVIRAGIRMEVVDPQSDVVIDIGNNVNFEQNVHIVGRCSVIIKDNVSITGHCSIADITHPYEDVNNPIRIGDRISKEPSSVFIDSGTMVGFGAHISPGTFIGKSCVVGANSVVSGHFPDYCIIAGVPARIIKSYDFETGKWVNFNKVK